MKNKKLVRLSKKSRKKVSGQIVIDPILNPVCEHQQSVIDTRDMRIDGIFP